MAAFGDMGNRAFKFGRHVQSQFGRNMGVIVGNQAVFGHIDFAQDVEIGGRCFNVGIERGQGGSISAKPAASNRPPIFAAVVG